MLNLCRLDALKCLNNGQCAVNISLNITYCKCGPCYAGSVCENTWQQTQFDTDHVYLIIFIIKLCFSVLNNGVSLEIFIRCNRICRTNCGVYLIVYPCKYFFNKNAFELRLVACES